MTKKVITKAADGSAFSNEQNESNLYIPKINAFVVKVNSIEDIPEEFLKYVKEHDLPIYLLGE